MVIPCKVQATTLPSLPLCFNVQCNSLMHIALLLIVVHHSKNETLCWVRIIMEDGVTTIMFIALSTTLWSLPLCQKIQYNDVHPWNMMFIEDHCSQLGHHCTFTTLLWLFCNLLPKMKEVANSCKYVASRKLGPIFLGLCIVVLSFNLLLHFNNYVIHRSIAKFSHLWVVFDFKNFRFLNS